MREVSQFGLAFPEIVSNAPHAFTAPYIVLTTSQHHIMIVFCRTLRHVPRIEQAQNPRLQVMHIQEFLASPTSGTHFERTVDTLHVTSVTTCTPNTCQAPLVHFNWGGGLCHAADHDTVDGSQRYSQTRRIHSLHHA